MTVLHTVQVDVHTAGVVPEEAAQLARAKVDALLRHVGEPVLFARVTLRSPASAAGGAATGAPADAHAAVSVNGRIVCAHASAPTSAEAVSLLADRLRVRLDRAWPQRRGHRA